MSGKNKGSRREHGREFTRPQGKDKVENITSDDTGIKNIIKEDENANWKQYTFKSLMFRIELLQISKKK